MKITEIKLNPNNPRVIKDDKFDKLKKSIQDFPQMLELRPLVIDENNIVLGGNMRLRALQDLGIKEVPILYAKDLTEEQKKEFTIKDNLSYGEWDWDALANSWDSKLLNDWGLNSWNYHSVNDLDPEKFDEFKEVTATNNLFHLNISFDTEQERILFLTKNEIVLDNNFLRRNKTLSIHYPLERRKDIRNVEFE